MGGLWALIRLKLNLRQQLASATIMVSHAYYNYLMGEEIYGLTIMGDKNGPTVTPTFEQVLSYDDAIRKAFTLRLNQGIDIEQSLSESMRNANVKGISFTTPISISAGRSGLREIVREEVAAARGTTRQGPPQEEQEGKRRRGGQGRRGGRCRAVAPRG